MKTITQHGCIQIRSRSDGGAHLLPRRIYRFIPNHLLNWYSSGFHRGTVLYLRMMRNEQPTTIKKMQNAKNKCLQRENLFNIRQSSIVFK